MKPFKVKGQHQVARAEERNPTFGDYEGVQVTINDENGGWLYSCDVGVSRTLIADLKHKGQWSEALKVEMLRKRIGQILIDSQTLATGPVPDLRINDESVFLARGS